MIGRRGFISALAALPIAAAVVKAQPGAPTVTPTCTAMTSSTAEGATHRFIGYSSVDHAASRSGMGVCTVTVSCDTREFDREVARAQRVITATERRLARALRHLPRRL